MGAKTWILVYADVDAREALKAYPQPDRAKSLQLAQSLFPKLKLEPLEDGSLAYTSPPDGELYVGCFPGVSIVAHKDFALDHPSRLTGAFLEPAANGVAYLHAMHSAVDFLAFAKWEKGKLMRALSLSPDSGVLDDVGPRMKFEEPYWDGKHPATDPEEEEEEYPLPFHPLDLGEEALLEFFGYQLEGFTDGAPVDPEKIPLLRFKRSKSWKFW